VDEVEGLEDAGQELAHHPEHPLEGPRREGDANVLGAPLVDQAVEAVAAVDDVVEDAVGDVEVAAQADAPLGEVAELVGEDRLELRER
jgi:hypothetical protein